MYLIRQLFIKEMILNHLENFLLIVLLFSFTDKLTAQDDALTDSLLAELATTKDNNKKLKILYELSDANLYSNQENAEKFINNGLNLTRKLGNKNKEVDLLNLKGILRQQQGLSAKALVIYKTSDSLSKAINYHHGEAEALGLIGGIYYYDKQYRKCLRIQIQGLRIKEQTQDSIDLDITLGNIGGCYIQMGILDSAEMFFKKAISVSRSRKEDTNIAFAYHSLANIREKQGDFDQALVYYDSSYYLNNKGGDKRAVLYTLSNKGDLLLRQKRYKKAMECFEDAFALADEIKYTYMYEISAKHLSEISAELGNYKSAYEYRLLYEKMRDSVNNADYKNELAAQSTLYETEKKETEIASLKKEGELNKELRDQERQRNIWLAVGLGLAVLLGIVFLVGFIRKKRDNRLIRSQKDLIEHVHQEITDSITYALRIQKAILPPLSLVKKHLADSFLIYKPKDIVAGDFYWLEPQDETVMFAVADCTGHGVPGAMVSVICNNAMNRAVREFQLSDPGKILDKTRVIVIQEFEKSEEAVKDGMDIALCILDGAVLKYAGAHNPLWIIRHGAGEVEEYKATKQPIGEFDATSPFKTHEIQLNRGDTIYIFSDGFPDQFGGEKGKKYKPTNFRKLLLSVQNETLYRQKKLIEESFENWKGSLEQVDDVCVIGVRIT